MGLALPALGRRGLAVLVAATAATLPATVAAPAGAQVLSFTLVWSKTVADGSPISTSSPNVAILGGAPAVVVGDIGGYISAFSLATGAPVAGWPASTGGVPVESTPSVAAYSAGSPDDAVFVGAGTAAKPHEGGYEAFKPNARPLWYQTVHSPGTTNKSGVVASLAVGDLQGTTDVVAPSLGQEEDAIDAATGKVLPGFPWFQGDSDFATPALADLFGGKLDIVNGGGQTPGLAYKVHYTKGGHVRVLLPTGNQRQHEPWGGQVCTYNPKQSVESSPAVGPFLADGGEGIATGTGDFWAHATQTDVVLAFTDHCKLVWSATLDGLTTSSPALADLSGNGALDVVEGTNDQHGGGTVYALSGATGAVLWQKKAPGEVIGGIVTADLGGGHQDVIVVGTGGAEVLDGENGNLLATLGRFIGFQNCALVTDDPNGTIGITLAGYNSGDHGVLEHFELKGSKGTDADEAGSWPMFHHDPSLSGNSQALLSMS